MESVKRLARSKLLREGRGEKINRFSFFLLWKAADEFVYVAVGHWEVLNAVAVDPEAVQLAGARTNSGSELQSQTGPNRPVLGDITEPR